MTAGKIKTIIAALIFVSALGVIVYFFANPLTTDSDMRKEVADSGMDLLALHEKYPDVIGWINVEGTNINYPVMMGEKYLYRTFKGEYDASGTPFVEDGWTPEDRCTIIYGHNMWMYKTMFNALHKFEDEEFYRKHNSFTFYAVCGEGEPYVEKRTFRISHCIMTDVSKWEYGLAQNMTSDDEMDEFLAECDKRSLYGSDMQEGAFSTPGKITLLSTCSYHIKGKSGRTVLAGKIRSVEEDSIVPDGKGKNSK